MTPESATDTERALARLAELEELHAAIQAHLVDAFVVDGAQGKRVFVLEGADRPYRTLIEGMRQGALTFDADGLILYCNRRFAELLEHAPEKVVATSLFDWFDEDGRAACRALVERARVETTSAELKLRRASGATLPVYVSIDALASESGAEFGAVVTDLSEQIAHRELAAAEELARQRSLELEDAARRKDHFLALLGHELRNPLGSLHHASEVLRRQGSTADGDVRFACGVIERQVRQMTRLVDDLLDVSRIAHGKIVLRKEPIDLTSFVRVLAEDRRSEIVGAGLALDLRLPPRSAWVSADPARLAQMIGNLLHNACKFTPGGGTVRITLSIDGGEDVALVEVADTGIGIAPAHLVEIFEPFRQHDLDRGGLGLGLSLVKGLAQMHGGSVRAESAGHGRGSTFTLRLPLVPHPSAENVAAEGSPSRLRRVLLIGTRPEALDALRLRLVQLGARVDVASTTREALEAARAARPDVVFCENETRAGLDCVDVARALRDSRSRPRLVAFAHRLSEQSRQRALAAGFDTQVLEPLEGEVLRQILGSIEPGD